MKAKKLLALTLALILALSCMSLTAFAATQVCTTCNGTGEIVCTNDNCVNGIYICPTCNGIGSHGGVPCPFPTNTECIICDGDGKIPCTNCNGDGKIVTPELQYQQIVSTVINGTKDEIKIGTITGYLDFKAGDILTKIDVVNTASNDADAETTIYAEFGDQTDENDKNNFYIYLKENAENGTYYIRLKTTQENTTVYTYIPFAVVNTILDLEEDDEYLDNATVDQTYTAEVYEQKTGKTKVQVSWKLENITASVTNNKIWDTEKLTWVEDTANQNTATANDVTAEFDFVNRSSINIDAQVTFKVADGFTAITPTFVDDGVTEKADGIITLGTKADGENTDNDGEIKATISPIADDFEDKTGNGTYGTYTVTIRKQAPAKTVCATFVDGTTMSWEQLQANYNDVTETSIGDGAFVESELVSIIIPDGVTSIGEFAFYGCTSLKEITIPDGVESIGNSAFRGTIIESITIPDSVTSIGEEAFYCCKSLGTITIPYGVESIGNAAFYACTSLKEITIPNSVKSIGDSAFASCKSLGTIKIPNSVESIGDSAFASCKSLGTITIPNGVTSIGSNTFKKCTALVSITIPDSVKSIGDSAFNGCTSLETITIPGSVESIYYGVFEGCSKLTINCSAFAKQPDGWDYDWNVSDCTVIWGN